MKKSCFKCKYFQLNEYGVMYCNKIGAIMYSSKACRCYEEKENPPQNITLLDFSGDGRSPEGEN
jgi:hypothetical protein